MANQFMEKVLNFIKKEDRAALKVVTDAVGKAIRQEVAENKKAGKRSFHLMEGTVYQHTSGKYEFIPSATMKAILENDFCPPLLRIEETRFLELLKLVFAELSEADVAAETEKKEFAALAKEQEKQIREQLEKEYKEKYAELLAGKVGDDNG